MVRALRCASQVFEPNVFPLTIHCAQDTKNAVAEAASGTELGCGSFRDARPTVIPAGLSDRHRFPWRSASGVCTLLGPFPPSSDVFRFHHSPSTPRADNDDGGSKSNERRPLVKRLQRRFWEKLMSKRGFAVQPESLTMKVGLLGPSCDRMVLPYSEIVKDRKVLAFA